jgi:hypothetical protein
MHWPLALLTHLFARSPCGKDPMVPHHSEKVDDRTLFFKTNELLFIANNRLTIEQMRTYLKPAETLFFRGMEGQPFLVRVPLMKC